MSEQVRHRVLLIDDDPHYSELIGQQLSGRFDVCFERTLEDGIRQMDQREPDAVLLDLKLPDSCTIPVDTLVRLKQHRHRAAIIIVSGNADPDVVYQLIQGNASGYILKGKHDVDSERLANDIVLAIESHRFCGNIESQTKSKL